MGALNQLADGISHAVGVVSDEVAHVGKVVAESPVANMAISAVGAYFNVPPSVTAALLGANAAGQHGDLMEGLKAGALSYGTGAATNSLIGTADAGSALGSSTVAPTTADAASAADASRAVDAFHSTIADTTGLNHGSGVMDTLKKVYDTVSSGAGKVYDSVSSGIGKAADKIGGIINGTAPDVASTAGVMGGTPASGAAAMGSKGLIGWAQANPMASMMALNAVGGAYTANANREAATKQIEAQRANTLADRDAYNASFAHLNGADTGPVNAGTPTRLDGSPLYNPDGTINSGARKIIPRLGA